MFILGLKFLKSGKDLSQIGKLLVHVNFKKKSKILVFIFIEMLYLKIFYTSAPQRLSYERLRKHL